MDMQTVIEAFELLDTWEDRFEYVTDLGRELVPFPAAQRTDANLIPGCDTRTWLIGQSRPGEPPLLDLIADAETPLVRGLVAVLLLPYRDKTPEEVLSTDPRPFFEQLQLEAALSAKRQAGMEAFLDRVRRIANQRL